MRGHRVGRARAAPTPAASRSSNKGHRVGQLMLLTLILIILARFEHLKECRHPGAWSLGCGHRPTGSGNRLVLLASGAYLDSAGQLSQVFNEFVDALLEKVSFLVEVVIESSLDEECQLAGNECGPSRMEESCLSYALHRNLTPTSGEPTLESARQVSGTRISVDKFDPDEFKNVSVFLEHFNWGTAGDERRSGTSAGRAGGHDPVGGAREDEPEKQETTGCKLFTLDVSQQDLPVSEMGTCCAHFRRCYAMCGQKKLDCDLAFRACLTRLCKLNFDYKNATLIERNKVRLTRRHLLEDSEPLDEQDEPAAHRGGPAGDVDGRATAQVERPSWSTSGRPVGSDLEEAGLEEAEVGGEPALSVSPSGPTTMDADLKTTVKRLRDKYKACKLASKLLIIGNLAFGCQTYRHSQWHACCNKATAGERTRP